MPGVKSIIWNDGTDAQLLKALVAVLNTSVSEAQAQEIARLMGNGVTSNAIKHRVNTHKKQSGAAASSVASPKTPTPRRQKASPMKATPTKQKRLAKLMEDDSDADCIDSGDEDLVADAKESTPKSTRARRSMADAAKKINYAKLNDPHADEVSDEDIGTKRKRDEDSNSVEETTSKAQKLTETASGPDNNNAETGFGDGF